MLLNGQWVHSYEARAMECTRETLTHSSAIMKLKDCGLLGPSVKEGEFMLCLFCTPMCFFSH